MRGKLILLVVAITVAVLISEFLLILFGIEQPFSENEKRGSFYDHQLNVPGNHYYSFSPNSTFKDVCDEFNYSKNTNNLGFVDKQVPEKFSSSTLVTFGDSFTEGAGAPYLKSWPHQLATRLNAQCSISTMNFGIAGCDPVFSLKYFEDIVLPKLPEFVILSINETDIGEVAIRGDDARFLPNGSVQYRNPHDFYWLFRRSRLVRLVYKRLLGRNDNMWSPDRSEQERQWAKGVIRNTIVRFDSICKANNIKFVAVFHPMPGMEMPESVFDSELKEVFLNPSDVLCIDLFKPLHSYLPPDVVNDFYWPGDGHFNEKGYRLMADVIFKMSGNKLCPPS